MRKWLASCLCLIALSVVCLSSAETIVLKSGDKVEGMVVEKNDKFVRFNTKGIPINYYLDEIATIDGVAVKEPVSETFVVPVVAKPKDAPTSDALIAQVDAKPLEEPASDAPISAPVIAEPTEEPAPVAAVPEIQEVKPPVDDKPVKFKFFELSEVNDAQNLAINHNHPITFLIDLKPPTQGDLGAIIVYINFNSINDSSIPEVVTGALKNGMRLPIKIDVNPAMNKVVKVYKR
jgi:hypothetical protein